MDEQDEIQIEPEIEVGAEGGDPESLKGQEEKAEGKIAKMRGELATCRKEKQEYMDGWQRAKADYANLLKRTENDCQASELKGKIKAVETLLPAFDALERAREHLPAGRQVVDSEGFLAIARQLESAFASLGLEEVGKVGEKFDPAYHDALGQDAAENAETDDTITAVLEKGWKISSTKLGTSGDIVIRPAKVRVAHFANDKQEA